MSSPSIAVAIPCLNEELTIAKVIAGFRRHIPQASICVFDNGSSDSTVARAFSAGAEVFTVPAKGKGNVVRAIFATLDAAVVVMVDGDDTYPSEDVLRLIDPVLAGTADMVVGSRMLGESQSQFRFLNLLGNRLFAGLASCIFRRRITDALSGFRAFSRSFVRSADCTSTGFEIEMELAGRAARKNLRVLEVAVGLAARPSGSHSKIRLFSDGCRILASLLHSAVR